MDIWMVNGEMNFFRKADKINDWRYHHRCLKQTWNNITMINVSTLRYLTHTYKFSASIVWSNNKSRSRSLNPMSVDEVESYQSTVGVEFDFRRTSMSLLFFTTMYQFGYPSPADCWWGIQGIVCLDILKCLFWRKFYLLTFCHCTKVSK